jgi:hypothetical protein
MKRTLPVLDLGRLDITEMTCNIFNIVLLGGVIENLGPQNARLLEVNCGVANQYTAHDHT